RAHRAERLRAVAARRGRHADHARGLPDALRGQVPRRGGRLPDGPAAAGRAGMKATRARRSASRTRVLYRLLVPLILTASIILGFFLWQTWGRYARLGEETIVESTLLLVREKVDLIEQIIIGADNAVF